MISILLRKDLQVIHKKRKRGTGFIQFYDIALDDRHLLLQTTEAVLVSYM
jgi:hypothetical protein